ncbi:tyrosine-type recombinase/integrase [Halobacteriaceae archaeon GCM10025711]
MTGRPTDLKPREAVTRYIDRRSTEITDQSQSTYYYRLKLWADWCEDRGIERVSEYDGWIFEQYEAHRSGLGITTNTLHNELETLKGHIEYLERIEAVDDGLADKVHIPEVPEDERSRDTMLAPDRAIELIKFYRSSDEDYATRFHTLLELAWHTGARVGALRALDLRDFDAGDRLLEFVHRPETDTPLKNKRNGERMVSLREPVRNVVGSYILHHRADEHDKYGRQPLFATIKGRPTTGTLRTWMYQATLPCVRTDCPHGHEPETCNFTQHTHASKCPSSRAPHHVRTGSLTWHRDRGVPKEVTGERVNASQDVIDEYYDKASQRERMELRRRPHLDKLTIGDNS